MVWQAPCDVNSPLAAMVGVRIGGLAVELAIELGGNEKEGTDGLGGNSVGAELGVELRGVFCHCLGVS